MALIRIFGGEGLTSDSYVKKKIADSKNHNLIDRTNYIFAKNTIFGLKKASK